MPEKSQTGTGRHPHKDSEEPWTHTKNAGSHQGRGQEQASSGEERGSSRSSGRSEENDESSDLKSREYRDENGQIHHHTRTAQAMKGKSGGRSGGKEQGNQEEEAA